MMTRLCLIVLAATGLALSPVRAQSDAGAEALLAYDCGSRDEADAFRATALSLGADAERAFLAALQDGAPAPMRAAAEKRLAAQYDALANMLADEGAALARAMEEGGPALPSREAFIADGLKRLDTRARENAVRGLGAIGGSDAAAAIRKAAEGDADLRPLADAALRELSARQ
jgi:hypothetical protein